MEKQMICVAAHRGNSILFPENTMPAYRSALELPIDQIEIDLHMTKDGRIVMIHDHTVDKTTNGTGLVRNMTATEIRALDAGSWKDKRFAGKKHYFYGTRAGDLEKLIPALRRDYPHLQICGWEPSLFRELTDEEVESLAARVREAEADFLWVALGAPRQEKLMFRMQKKT